MKIDEKSMFFWGLLGFKIGRLEFLWDSPYKEAQAVFEESKNEILRMVGDEVPVNETDYKAFAESITYFYMKNDVEKFSLLMIGRCIQRCGLLSACKGTEARNEMLHLASSCLDSIPISVVKDKDLLFSTIVKNHNKSFTEIMSMLYEAVLSEEDSEQSEYASVEKKNKDLDGYLFISYSSKDYETAMKIREFLEDNGIRCWMAPASILGGMDYSEVIVDAIERSSGVVLVLTDNSQESKWVPKELDIAITADKIIIPVHTDSSAIIKKMHFRITDSQVIEAYGDVSSVFDPLIKAARILLDR